MSDKENLQPTKLSLRPAVSSRFKAINFAIFILGLVSMGIVIAHDFNNPHPTSGAGEIWWASTPEVVQAYEHLTAKIKNDF